MPPGMGSWQPKRLRYGTGREGGRRATGDSHTNIYLIGAIRKWLKDRYLRQAKGWFEEILGADYRKGRARMEAECGR
jgi:hypothetical protein